MMPRANTYDRLHDRPRTLPLLRSPAADSDADVVLLAARTRRGRPRAPRARRPTSGSPPLLARLGAKGAADEFTRIPRAGRRRRSRRGRRPRRPSGCREPPPRRGQRGPTARRHRLASRSRCPSTTPTRRRRSSRARRSAPTRSPTYRCGGEVAGRSASRCTPSLDDASALDARALRRRRRGPHEGPRQHAAGRPVPRAVRRARGRAPRTPPASPSQVWDEAALEADGFGGILGVGQGSSRGAAARPPRVRARRGIRAPRARRQGHHVRLGRPLAEARRRRWSA